MVSVGVYPNTKVKHKIVLLCQLVKITTIKYQVALTLVDLNMVVIGWMWHGVMILITEDLRGWS